MILKSIFEQFSYFSSKCFIRQQRQLTATHFAQELLMKVQCSGDSRSFAKETAAAKSLQSCPTLCNSVDGSPPGSSVPGILQARTLEWVEMSAIVR